MPEAQSPPAEGPPETAQADLGGEALAEAIAHADAAACERWLAEAETSEAVRVLAHLDDEERVALFGLLSPETAADVLKILPDSQAIEAMESLHAPVAAQILEGLSSDERADVIKAMADKEAEAVLTHLDREVADDVRRLARYHEDTAGALMLTEYLAYPETATIREVLADIEANAEKYSDYNIQYTYVIDVHGYQVDDLASSTGAHYEVGVWMVNDAPGPGGAHDRGRPRRRPLHHNGFRDSCTAFPGQAGPDRRTGHADLA